MDQSNVPMCLEKRNVFDSHDRMLSVPKQENEIVAMKYGGLALRSGRERFLN